MYLSYRRLKIQILLAALCLCATKASFGTGRMLECAPFLAGNVAIDGTLLNDTYHRGLIIPKGSRLGFDTQCEASWADTVQAVNFKGVELAAGKLTFNRQGQIQFAPLAKSVLPNGASVMGANEVQQTNVSLSQEEKFKEEVFGKNVTAFYDSGFPKQAYLNRSSNINGVWFSKNNDPIQFYADGSVASAELERNTSFNDIVISPGAVRFHESGFIRASFTLSSPLANNDSTTSKVKLGEFWLFTNTSYSLNDTQNLVEFESSDYTWYQERLYPPFTQIHLAADGSVEWDTYYAEIDNASIEQIENGEAPEVLQHAQVLRGVLLPKGALVFMSDGLVRRVAMPRNFTYANVTLRAGLIYFNDAHSIRGTLAQDTLINGVIVPQLAELEFRHGQVVQVMRANFASNELEY